MSEVSKRVVIFPEASGTIEWEVTLTLDGSGFDRNLQIVVKRLVLLPNAPEPTEMARITAEFPIVNYVVPG